MSKNKGFFIDQICALRKKSLRNRKKREANKAIAAWIEEDRLISEPGQALVIIMNSIGCEWARGEYGGCSMCGYSNDTIEKITADDLIQQIDDVLSRFSEKKFQAVKLFNSGSFLDEKEIPIKAQEKIMQLINSLSNVTEIIIESRPEYVTDLALQRIQNQLQGKALEIGIGLESSNDFIRINNINKGFLFSDFQKAVKIALKNNARVKSYLLFKPPFLTEKEAIEDMIHSVLDSIKAGARSISINPLNIQGGTLVFELWNNNLYRSPWFWSLREVLQTLWDRIKAEGLEKDLDRILSDPSGAGSNRGIHNCKLCDKDFIKALKRYNLSQDPAELNINICQCFKLWEEFLSYEVASLDQSLSMLEYGKKFL